MEIEIMNHQQKKIGVLKIMTNLLRCDYNESLIHQVINGYLSNFRKASGLQKNRAAVKHSTKKPWKQKGTGRARSGNTRSPIWRGGMTVFGPSPRSYAFTLSKKSKKIALKSVLAERFANKSFAVVDSIVLEQPKTKDAAAILQKLSLPNKTLFILSEKNQNFQLAVRNLTETNVLLVDGLNVFDLLRHEKIVCTKDALRKIEERLN